MRILGLVFAGTSTAQHSAMTRFTRETLGLEQHTYATFALGAGVPVFAVSRFIGSSIAMIDRHYGHLANDSRQHAVSLPDALAVERTVDAGGRRNRSPRRS